MSPATHPIRGDVPDVQQAMANFDNITYDKGEAVLHQLSAYVGEDAFVEGLRAYFAKHAWGNTVLDDLMAEFAAASGRDLAQWTADWLDRAGTDTLVLDGSTLRATAPDGGAPRPHRLRIAGYDEALVPTGEVEVEVSGAETAVELPGGAVHQVNAGDLTYAAVRADAGSLETLRRRAGELPDPLARTLAVTTAWDMLVKGELGSDEVVDAITGLVATEPSPAVVEALLAIGLQAAESWTPLARIPELTGRLAAAAADLAHSEQHRQPALRTLAATATSAAHFELLAEAATDDVDLAWRLLGRQAELGEYDIDSVEALLARDPDPDAASSALSVKASQDDPAAKETAWRALIVDRSVPAGTARRAVTQRFWRPLQVDVLAEYPDRYLEALASFGSAGMLGQLGIMRGMFPYAVVDEPFLQRATTAAMAADVNPTVRTALLLGTDVGTRMLRARTA
jgi:aminopeptidase N